MYLRCMVTWKVPAPHLFYNDHYLLCKLDIYLVSIHLFPTLLTIVKNKKNASLKVIIKYWNASPPPLIKKKKDWEIIEALLIEDCNTVIHSPRIEKLKSGEICFRQSK